MIILDCQTWDCSAVARTVSGASRHRLRLSKTVIGAAAANADFVRSAGQRENRLLEKRTADMEPNVLVAGFAALVPDNGRAITRASCGNH